MTWWHWLLTGAVLGVPVGVLLTLLWAGLRAASAADDAMGYDDGDAL